jgi:hypothetical protein
MRSNITAAQGEGSPWAAALLRVKLDIGADLWPMIAMGMPDGTVGPCESCPVCAVAKRQSNSWLSTTGLLSGMTG